MLEQRILDIREHDFKIYLYYIIMYFTHLSLFLAILSVDTDIDALQFLHSLLYRRDSGSLIRVVLELLQS